LTTINAETAEHAEIRDAAPLRGVGGTSNRERTSRGPFRSFAIRRASHSGLPCRPPASHIRACQLCAFCEFCVKTSLFVFVSFVAFVVS
jgi:hypothetical protein